LDIFSNFGNRVFWGTDVSIANLEGPISEQPIIDDITANNLSFNFPPKTVKALSWLHLKTVSLANNHSLNAGAEGLEITKKMLDQSKISYFGHQIQFGDFSVFESKSGDIPVSVIGIDTLVDVPNLELEEKIKSEKSKGQFIIIMPHWGNEYQTTHSPQQEAMAKKWISWGADLIIGSHPHVVQDAQEIDGVPVFYSLGNLLFDQTFSKETQEGLIIAGKITKEEIQIIIAVNENDSKSDGEPFFSNRLLKPIMLAFFIAFFNQISGINFILYYSPEILERAGLAAKESLFNSIAIGGINLIFTFVGLYLIDRMGRKLLLI